MALSKSAVVAIVLGLIGGIPLLGLFNHKSNCAQPIASQISLLGLAGMALSVAASLNPELGKKIAGLAEIAENPMGALSDAVSKKVKDYTKDNFSGLSTILDVASDTTESVSSAYKNFTTALGGTDGTNGGAAAALTKHKEYTDNIIGTPVSDPNNQDQLSAARSSPETI